MVSLQHLVEILQLDLVLPVTREDQAVLTHFYGIVNDNGQGIGSSVIATRVDAIQLFNDAGISIGLPQQPIVQHPVLANSDTRNRSGEQQPPEYVKPHAATTGRPVLDKARQQQLYRPSANAATVHSAYALPSQAARAMEEDDSDLDTPAERLSRTRGDELHRHYDGDYGHDNNTKPMKSGDNFQLLETVPRGSVETKDRVRYGHGNEEEDHRYAQEQGRTRYPGGDNGVSTTVAREREGVRRTEHHYVDDDDDTPAVLLTASRNVR